MVLSIRHTYSLYNVYILHNLYQFIISVTSCFLSCFERIYLSFSQGCPEAERIVRVYKDNHWGDAQMLSEKTRKGSLQPEQMCKAFWPTAIYHLKFGRTMKDHQWPWMTMFQERVIIVIFCGRWDWSVAWARRSRKEFLKSSCHSEAAPNTRPALGQVCPLLWFYIANLRSRITLETSVELVGLWSELQYVWNIAVVLTCWVCRFSLRCRYVLQSSCSIKSTCVQDAVTPMLQRLGFLSGAAAATAGNPSLAALQLTPWFQSLWKTLYYPPSIEFWPWSCNSERHL